MGNARANDVTGLLAAWRGGDADAAQALAALVYDDMRTMAARRLAGGRALPLQTTELVHETFARLRALQVKDRMHFFRTVAMVLRQVLTDAIRRERAEKRGGALAVSLSAAGDLAVVGPRPLSIDGTGRTRSPRCANAALWKCPFCSAWNG
jgi:RNA polymerase sigma factor (TIGR02999 family)